MRKYTKFIPVASVLILLTVHIITGSLAQSAIVDNSIINVDDTIVIPEMITPKASLPTPSNPIVVEEIIEEPIIEEVVVPEEPQYFKPEKLKQELFDLVLEECDNNDVPAYDVLALMKTESQNFNENAKNVNSNGTFDSGIMQINSINREYFAKQYDVPEFAKNPMDPVANITAGIRFFADIYHKYLEKYEGDLDKAFLATTGAYNRGEGNQNKYHNIYDHNARAWAHRQNLIDGIDEDLRYDTEEMKELKQWLKDNYIL